MVQQKPREGDGHSDFLLSPPFYFIWEPIPCDGAVHILGKSTFVSPHWKCLPTYTQRCASTSLMTKRSEVDSEDLSYHYGYEHMNMLT